MDEAKRRYIERFALLMNESGMPRMAARVYACVLAEDAGSLTAAELAERLQASPAAISGAVRYCVQVGVLSRGREPGSRRDHYFLDDGDLWFETFARRDAVLARWEEAMGDGVRVLGADGPAGRRLRSGQRFLAFLRGELPRLLARWDEHEDGASRER